MKYKERDFEKKDLFKTRNDLIQYIFEHRKLDLLKIAFLTLPFTVLFFVWTIFSRYHFMGQSDILTYCMVNSLPGLFLSFLLGVGMSGSYYSARRLIFGDTIRTPYHFFKGIKESGFECGVFASLFYVIIALLDMLDKSLLTSNIAIYPLISVIIFIMEAFLLYVLYLAYSSCTLYVVSFTTAIKDSLSLMIKDPLGTIKSFLLSMFPLFLVLPYMYFSQTLYLNIVGAVLFCLYSSFFGVFFTIHTAYDSFDELVNKNVYPNFYRKGLYKEEDK